MNKQKIKKLGILGGMGPQATNYFLKKIIEHTEASCDQDHVDLVIINRASTPDRTKAILTEESEELLISIRESLRLLENCGVDNIAIPCNTSHFFYKEIQSKTNIPIINMVEETIKSVASFGGSGKVGILGTDGTLSTGIYGEECSKYGLEAIYPESEGQKKIMQIIYDDIKSGKKGDYVKFMEVLSELKEKGCDTVILACTELSYLNDNYDLPSYCVDALEILVKKSIELSGKVYKN